MVASKTLYPVHFAGAKEYGKSERVSQRSVFLEGKLSRTQTDS